MSKDLEPVFKKELKSGVLTAKESLLQNQKLKTTDTECKSKPSKKAAKSEKKETAKVEKVVVAKKPRGEVKLVV